MKKYQHIFFDLDHTLWDYDRNVQESLSEIFDHFELINFGITNAAHFIKGFYQVNYKLWDLYNQGKIDKIGLRESRFRLIFEEIKATSLEIPSELELDFMHRTSTKQHLLPYALEILEYLKPGYPMHIITNGFNESQEKKLIASGLTPYFDLIITSETTGHKKPDARIFHYALEKLGVTNDKVLMIGDNPNSDILGAINANIDQVYFDPSGKGCDYKPTYTISHLKELESLL
ncbi:YjjG family noncanonical pyrimidine nucleotidase [Belliella kenyensis]|uniref:YjjG family noncanonical pyrimidine nucleotidase n=1 Tax=Belliella kenyensis TaxID=1472724 RepID=A0ABV8EJJ7_9BACT|nr:YjjG family noncanonical pyrimidine nucleotidase [Belliella kenyensis]MCH7402684.1 YjjG family noncanonical pyrimidine nucleotidase [Belliella kenyensis]MDN3603768.1 YjjG family noncanonical pyrimidine nucleotidase [Belliella kenyensis]